MYVVVLTYRKPLETVERFIAGHRAFLERYYQSGLFLASGPREPRTGGVILAGGCHRETLEAAFEEDPFKREGIAGYEVIEFRANRMHAEIGSLLGQLSG